MINSHKLGLGKLGTFIACTTIFLCTGSNAWAALAAYEGFNYTPETLLVSGGVGLGGATDGWAGPWDENQAPSFYTRTKATSLSYMDGLGNALTTTGGKLLNTGVDDTAPTGSQTSQPGRSLAARRTGSATGPT